MEKSEIREKVIMKIADMLRLQDPNKIKDEDTLEDLEADSLDKVEIMMAFEDDFGLEILDDDAVNLRTVGQIVDFIYKASNPNEDLSSKSTTGGANRRRPFFLVKVPLTC